MFSEVGPLAIPSFSLDGTRWCASTGREPPTGFVGTEAGLEMEATLTPTALAAANTSTGAVDTKLLDGDVTGENSDSVSS